MNSEQNKKDRDKDKILHTLQDMFIDVLDLEVIQNVAHNCDFSRVRTYDKSSMTNEEDRDFAAAMLASAHEREENFNQLLAIFKFL